MLRKIEKIEMHTRCTRQSLRAPAPQVTQCLAAEAPPIATWPRPFSRLVPPRPVAALSRASGGGGPRGSNHGDHQNGERRNYSRRGERGCEGSKQRSFIFVLRQAVVPVAAWAFSGSPSIPSVFWNRPFFCPVGSRV